LHLQAVSKIQVRFLLVPVSSYLILSGRSWAEFLVSLWLLLRSSCPAEQSCGGQKKMARTSKASEADERRRTRLVELWKERYPPEKRTMNNVLGFCEWLEQNWPELLKRKSVLPCEQLKVDLSGYILPEVPPPPKQP
jgi:hypothetical protein